MVRHMRDEFFGPIVTLHVYPDDAWEETLDARRSDVAVRADRRGVRARSRARSSRPRTALRDAAGNFYINDKPTGAVVGQQPFGGARASGTDDKAGSPLNLLRFVAARTIKETFVVADRLPLRVPRRAVVAACRRRRIWRALRRRRMMRERDLTHRSRMNRKLVGGLVGAVDRCRPRVVLRVPRSRWHARRRSAEGSDRSAAIKPEPKPPDKSPKGDARGGPIEFELDRDAEGPLQLEGQVLGRRRQGRRAAPRSGSSRCRRARRRPTTTARSRSTSWSAATYALTATSGELIGGPVTYKLTDKSDPVVIRLGKGATLVVTVVDDHAAPIQGATRARSAPPSRRRRPTRKARPRCQPVKPGWVSAQAVAEGYAPNTTITTIGNAGAVGRITITLHEGFPVSGRVVDDKGKPIAKASVRARNGEWGLPKSADEGELTDAKGQFTVRALAAGDHRSVAVDGEHAPSYERVTVSTSR